MIRHIVMWKFLPGTKREQAEFFDRLRALVGVIPQLRHCEIVMAVGEDNYDAMLLSEFDSLADLEIYKKDPRHVAVSALCKNIRETRAAVDYEVAEGKDRE